MGDLGYNRAIAQASLNIDAIKLSPDKPFKWASGFYMPIYNDNRRLLGSYDHRVLVTDAFESIVRENNIEVDYVAGTVTAGIAPAASLALRLNKPLLIFENGQPYVFCISNNPKERPDVDAIATTCPWAIFDGVHMANEFKLPFMYVRANPKAHGLKQQVEGNPISGQTAHLIDFHTGESYLRDAEAALEEKGVRVRSRVSGNTSTLFRPAKLKRERVLVIEDLVSTGGSSVKEVQQYRAAGAQVDHCISIFNYGLDEALRQFDEANCRIHSALDHNTLLETAMQERSIEGHQIALLKEWRTAPFQWGEKHGFPPEKKQ